MLKTAKSKFPEIAPKTPAVVEFPTPKTVSLYIQPDDAMTPIIGKNETAYIQTVFDESEITDKTVCLLKVEEGCFLGYVETKNNSTILRAENSKYKPMIFGKHEARIYGVFYGKK